MVDSKCPNPDCRQKLDDVHETVFKDHEGGCRFDISKLKSLLLSCVTRRHLWIFAIVVGIPVFSSAVGVWAVVKYLPGEVSRNTSAIEKNISLIGKDRERIDSLDTRTSILSYRLDSLGVQMDKLESQQKESTKKIIDAIDRIR